MRGKALRTEGSILRQRHSKAYPHIRISASRPIADIPQASLRCAEPYLLPMQAIGFAILAVGTVVYGRGDDLEATRQVCLRVWGIDLVPVHTRNLAFLEL